MAVLTLDTLHVLHTDALLARCWQVSPEGLCGHRRLVRYALPYFKSSSAQTPHSLINEISTFKIVQEHTAHEILCLVLDAAYTQCARSFHASTAARAIAGAAPDGKTSAGLTQKYTIGAFGVGHKVHNPILYHSADQSPSLGHTFECVVSSSLDHG